MIRVSDLAFLAGGEIDSRSDLNFLAAGEK
jgi:hypothetical protein